MKDYSEKQTVTLFSASAALVVFSSAGAQPYPAKPVRIVVPFPAGGGVDVTARILAQQLTTRMGQSFVVENRAGVAGVIGTEFAAKSTPDGYTLLVGSQTSQTEHRIRCRTDRAGSARAYGQAGLLRDCRQS